MGREHALQPIDRTETIGMQLLLNWSTREELFTQALAKGADPQKLEALLAELICKHDLIEQRFHKSQDQEQSP